MPTSTPNSVSILPPTQQSSSSLKEKANALRYNTQQSKDAPLWSTAGEAFSLTESRINHIENALRAPIPQPQIIQIVDPSGALVAEIGNLTGTNNESFPGIWGRNLYIGGTGPNNAPFFANGQIVVVGQNGQIFVLDPFENVGAWLGTQSELSKAVTGAANNGAGAIRLTVVAHGWVTGDEVNVATVGGVPNATGQWVITVFDANHVDLIGSTFAGAYTAGGTAQRYFTGGLFSTIAVGGAQRITNVANNGSGAVRVTVPAHGYATGYAVVLTGVIGVPNIDVVSWNITVIDVNRFDLIGSTFSGAYVSGGLSLNWPTAKFIARDDGSLTINGATIILNSNGITTEISNGPVSGPGGTPASSLVSIDNSTGALTYIDPFDVVLNNPDGRTVARLINTAGDGKAGVYSGSGVALHDGFVEMDGVAFTLTAYSGGAFGHHQGVLDHTSLDFSQTSGSTAFANYSQTGIIVSNGAGSTITITAINIDSPGYSVFGAAGIDLTAAFGVSLTVGTASFGVSLTVNSGSAVTNVTGVPGLVLTTDTFVTGVTLNLDTAVNSVVLNLGAPNTWSSGILTA